MGDPRVRRARRAGQAAANPRTVRGTKRTAQKLAASLTVEPPSPLAGHSVAEALDAWLEVSTPTWAVSTVRDQASRVSLVKRDPIARTAVGRLTVADVDRWHSRLRAGGVGESSIRNPAPRDPRRDVAGGALGLGADQRRRVGDARPTQGPAAFSAVGRRRARRDRSGGGARSRSGSGLSDRRCHRGASFRAVRAALDGSRP